MKVSYSFKGGLGLVLFAFLLSGCGGGGGGGGDDDLEYSGLTTPAKIGAANAPALTGNVVGVFGIVDNVDDAFRTGPADSSPPAGYLRGAMRHITGLVNNQVTDAVIARSAGRPVQRDVAIDESEACEQGSSRISGVIDDVDGTGRLTFAFDGCRYGSALIDGVFIARIDAFDFDFPLPTQLQLTFRKLRISDAGLDVSIGGTASYTLNIGANEQNVTLVDMVFRDNTSGEMLRVVDLVSVYRFDFIGFPSRFTIEIIRGRVYASVHGYVDVRSTVIIELNSIAQDYPDAGEYQLTAEGSIVATALSSSMVRIQADTDNNPGNGFEFVQDFTWDSL